MICEAINVYYLMVLTQFINFLQEITHFGKLSLLFNHAVNFNPKTVSGHAQVSLKNLTDVHTRWYTKRVKYDVYRRTVFIVWHIFYWLNSRDNTLVTVTSRHFITRLDVAFNR